MGEHLSLRSPNVRAQPEGPSGSSRLREPEAPRGRTIPIPARPSP
jgi:hypothetical protein